MSLLLHFNGVPRCVAVARRYGGYGGWGTRSIHLAYPHLICVSHSPYLLSKKHVRSTTGQLSHYKGNLKRGSIFAEQSALLDNLQNDFGMCKRNCSSSSKTEDRTNLWPSMQLWPGRPTVASCEADQSIFRDIESAQSAGDVLELMWTPTTFAQAKVNTDILRHALKHLVFKHYVALEKSPIYNTFLVTDIFAAHNQLMLACKQGPVPEFAEYAVSVLHHSHFPHFVALLEESLEDIGGCDAGEIYFLLQCIGYKSPMMTAIFSKGLAAQKEKGDLRNITFLNRSCWNYSLLGEVLKEIKRSLENERYSLYSAEDVRVLLYAMDRVSMRNSTFIPLVGDFLIRLLKLPTMTQHPLDFSLLARLMTPLVHTLHPEQELPLQISSFQFFNAIKRYDGDVSSYDIKLLHKFWKLMLGKPLRVYAGFPFQDMAVKLLYEMEDPQMKDVIHLSDAIRRDNDPVANDRLHKVISQLARQNPDMYFPFYEFKTELRRRNMQTLMAEKDFASICINSFGPRDLKICCILGKMVPNELRANFHAKVSAYIDLNSPKTAVFVASASALFMITDKPLEDHVMTTIMRRIANCKAYGLYHLLRGLTESHYLLRQSNQDGKDQAATDKLLMQYQVILGWINYKIICDLDRTPQLSSLLVINCLTFMPNNLVDRVVAMRLAHKIVEDFKGPCTLWEKFGRASTSFTNLNLYSPKFCELLCDTFLKTWELFETYHAASLLSQMAYFMVHCRHKPRQFDELQQVARSLLAQLKEQNAHLVIADVLCRCAAMDMYLEEEFKAFFTKEFLTQVDKSIGKAKQPHLQTHIPVLVCLFNRQVALKYPHIVDWFCGQRLLNLMRPSSPYAVSGTLRHLSKLVDMLLPEPAWEYRRLNHITPYVTPIPIVLALTDDKKLLPIGVKNYKATGKENWVAIVFTKVDPINVDLTPTGDRKLERIGFQYADAITMQGYRVLQLRYETFDFLALGSIRSKLFYLEDMIFGSSADKHENTSQLQTKT